MKKISFAIITVCTVIIMFATLSPKTETVVVTDTPTAVASAETTATATEVPTATAEVEPVYPPGGNRWIADAYKTHFYQGDCYSHGSEYSQGLTDFCQGKTLKIWSVWPGWYVAYEGKDGKSFKIPLSQGENTIQFPAEAWMIRIGR